MTRTERHRRAVAVHEAGHALFCRLVGVPVEAVTIEWSGTSHGALVYVGTPPPDSLLLILLAGEAATALADRLGWLERADQVTVGQEEEPGVRVTSDAENIRTALEQLYPDDRDAQERALLTARVRVDAAVERHWDEIVLVASALLETATLSGGDIRRIVETEVQHAGPSAHNPDLRVDQTRLRSTEIESSW